MPAGISAADMGISSNVGSGLNSALYAPPPELQSPSKPTYATPADMLTPYIPSTLKPGQQSDALKKYWNELIPTSVNVRNQALGQTLQQLATPMQSLYLSQGMDQAAQGYGQSMGALNSALASRGLIGSGIANAFGRQNSTDYLQNVAGAQAGAQQQSDQRQLNLISRVLGTPQDDMNFYNALRTGSLAASSQYGPYNYGWPQVAGNITSIVKTLASMGAGAAAGGAAGGSSTFGSGISATGGVDSGGAAMFGNDFGQSFSGPVNTGGGGVTASTGGGWPGAVQGYMGGGALGALGGYYGGGY